MQPQALVKYIRPPEESQIFSVGKPNLSTSCYHCWKQVSRAPLRLPFLQKHLKGSFTSSFTRRKKHSTPYTNHLRFPKDMQESTHPQNRKQHQQTCKWQRQAFIWQHCFQAQGTISEKPLTETKFKINCFLLYQSRFKTASFQQLPKLEADLLLALVFVWKRNCNPLISGLTHVVSG